jgi:hypothetical protein
MDRSGPTAHQRGGASHGTHPQTAYEVTDLQTAIGLVGAEQGICIALSRLETARGFQRNSTRRQIGFCLARKRRDHENTKVSYFCNWFKLDSTTWANDLPSLGYAPGIPVKDLVAKGYRWVAVNGPYACVTEQDVRQITSDHTDLRELHMVENL